MRNYLFFIILLAFGCNSSIESNKPKKLSEKIPTTITGTINNSNYPNIIIEALGDQHTAQIQDNRFSVKLMLDEPRVYNLRYGRRVGQLYVVPGDNVIFSTTANQFSQVMDFTGDRAVENIYMTEKADKDRKARSLKVKVYQKEEPDFIAEIDAERDSKNAAFKTFKETNTLDPFFQFLIETEINYEWANDRLIYPRYHAFYNKLENFDVSPVYYDFQRDLDKNDPGKLYSPNFTSFVSNYTDMQAGKIMEADSNLKFSENGMAKSKFDVINKEFTNAEIKEYLMYTTLKTHIRYEGANGTTPLLEMFNQTCTNQNFKNDIQKDYANWKGLETGNKAPTFAYEDIDGNLHDIASYKGKYIYIDIWATWCGPCKKEIPHLEALQEEYKGNDKILFTSVSIDKDKSAWERMVKDKNMQGLQLFAENEWRASIIRDYKISGIPRFLLIDDQGNIVSANAPRPSSDRIKAQLASLVGG